MKNKMNDFTHIITPETFPDWLDQLYPSVNQTVTEYAQELHGRDGDDDFYFDEDMDSCAAIRDALLKLYAQELYAGAQIPKGAALALLSANICEGSGFELQLQSFAYDLDDIKEN
jgi:hypothetical protein